jgi:hypothetical protein
MGWRGRTMARGPNLTDEQIERIKQVFAETGSVRGTARALSMPVSAVKTHCKQTDGYAQLRTEKRTALIGAIAEELATVRQLYLDHLKQPAVIAAASAKDAATIVGIFTDKHQLVTGEATERSEHVHSDDARVLLAQKVDEIAKRRLARQDSEKAI